MTTDLQPLYGHIRQNYATWIRGGASREDLSIVVIDEHSSRAVWTMFYFFLGSRVLISHAPDVSLSDVSGFVVILAPRVDVANYARTPWGIMLDTSRSVIPLLLVLKDGENAGEVRPYTLQIETAISAVRSA